MPAQSADPGPAHDVVLRIPLQALALELADVGPSPGFRTALRRRLLDAARTRLVPPPRSGSEDSRAVDS